MKVLIFIITTIFFSSCTSEKAQNYCGDGVVGEHEECEISDTKPCDNNEKLVTCSRYCTWNYSNCSDNCGDGVIQEEDGEECDGLELGGATCESLGYSRGNPLCSSDCKFDITVCEEAGSCGDGIFQSDWEECDSALPVECADLGYFTGTAACNEDCTVDDSACNHIYQWGCSSSNILFSNTVDSEGNLIVVGITQCSFDGQDNYGDNDGVVTKFDKYGKKLWTRIIGTAGNEFFYGVAADSTGNVFITGWTNTSWFSDIQGNLDAVVIKLDSDGNFLWGIQEGTSGEDVASSVVVKDNNIFVAGYSQGNFLGHTSNGSYDYFIMKINQSGEIIDSVLDGGSNVDSVYNIKIDKLGNLYLIGNTSSNLHGFTAFGSYDIHIEKYNGDLIRQQTFVTGTQLEDWGVDLAVSDDMEVFAVGYTQGGLGGNLNSGSYDHYFLKLNTDFEMVFCSLIGTSGEEGKGQLGNRAAFSGGLIFTVLNVSGEIEGGNYYGGVDPVIAVYDTEGNLVRLKYYGNAHNNIARGLSVGEDFVVISGSTLGDLLGYSTAGGDDFFIVKESTLYDF